MKNSLKSVVAAALSTTVLCGAVLIVTNAENPLAQNLYTADSAPMVHDGVLYLYTSHDKENFDYFYMPDWKCYSPSSSPTGPWIYRGVIMPKCETGAAQFEKSGSSSVQTTTTKPSGNTDTNTSGKEYFRDTFESGEGDWTGRGSATVSANSNANFQGSNSLYVDDRDASWNGATNTNP